MLQVGQEVEDEAVEGEGVVGVGLEHIGAHHEALGPAEHLQSARARARACA